MLIAIGGHTGTGKTTLAYALRDAFPFLHDALMIEDDQIRREMLARSLRERLNSEDYHPDVSIRVREKIDQTIQEALQKGQIVIDSSGFFKKEQRRAIEDLAQSCAVPFVGLWLVASRSVMEERIEKRMQERDDGHDLSVERGHASDACLGVIDKFGELPAPTSGAWTIIDSEAPIDKLLEHVRTRLAGAP